MNIPNNTKPYRRKRNPYAVASLVLGVLSVFIPLALIAIIIGIVAVNQIKKSNGLEVGRSIAVAGIIFGVVGFFAFPQFLVCIYNEQETNRIMQSSCASNLKNIALAKSLYSEDYNGRLPQKTNWSDCTASRLKSTQILKCPADAGKSRCSYSINDQLNGESISSIKKTDTTPLYFDSKRGWNSSSSISSAEPRHAGGSNFAFVDGHVKWVKEKQTSSQR